MGGELVRGYLGTLTTETRVLIHLSGFKHNSNDWSAPNSLTQSGIAAAVHIQRKHIPRTLNKLVEKNDVEIMKKHIPGGKQRRQIYFLSQKGHNRTLELVSNILEKICTMDGNTVRLSEVWERKTPLLEFLSHFDEGLNYSVTSLVTTHESPSESTAISKEQSEDLVFRLFKKAWLDGKITKDEQVILGEVIHFLGLSPEIVSEISDRARSKQASKNPDSVYFEMLKQALVDGEIVSDETALLNTLRFALKISTETHNELLNRAKSEMLLSPNVISYKSALQTALNDGVITEDESSILETLRNSLSISMKLHNELMESLRE